MWGQAPSLYQPVRGDLGVSSRRSSLQFNIRPWRASALGNPLLRLRLLRRTDSLRTRVAPWALAEKGPEVRLNGFGSNRFRGDRLMCGGPPPYASSAMRPTAHTQQASSRAVATFCRGPRARAGPRASRPASARPWRHASGRPGPGPGPWRGPSAERSTSGSATRPRPEPSSGACCRPW